MIDLAYPGRRPSIGEIWAYYSKGQILNEILSAMRRWHVKYVPGYAKSRWVYTEDAEELRSMIRRSLELMDRWPDRKDYPYFRIDWERHSPAHDWDPETVRGHDFVIEKDALLWQECFEAMLPVMDILEHFGVYYWLKYTGHHSLHLVIPAEVFPQTLRGIALQGRHEAVYYRLMTFLNKRATQAYNEHDRHCPPGTNMPYSVNEDTGLLNYPLLRAELEHFRPWHASVHVAQIRDFWRTVPETAFGKAEGLLEEVMRPFDRQTIRPPAVSCRPLQKVEPVPPADYSTEKALSDLKSDDERVRCRAAWVLMLLGDVSSLPGLCEALTDGDADVRWFAAEVLLRFGSLEALPHLLGMPAGDMAGASLVDFCAKHGELTVPLLIEALGTDSGSARRSLPIDKALERIGEASRPYLEARCREGSSERRRKAAAILDRLAGTPSMENGLEMSQDRRRRREAAQILGWYDDPTAIDRLVELTCDENPRTRRTAIKALIGSDSPVVPEVLGRALNDPDDKVRRWAQHGLDVARALKLLLDKMR